MKVKAVDVAAYILREKGSLEAKKLQKLVYYSQAQSFAVRGQPLFSDRMEAWVYGPVVPTLYAYHRGHYLVPVHAVRGDLDAMDAESRALVDDVIERYSGFTAAELIEMTHGELPWKQAREGCAPSERSDAVITHESMRAFHTSSNGTKDSATPLGVPGDSTAIDAQRSAMLTNILRNGRIHNFSPSVILDIVANQVSSSQRLEGVEMTSSDVRTILDGRPSA